MIIFLKRTCNKHSKESLIVVWIITVIQLFVRLKLFDACILQLYTLVTPVYLLTSVISISCKHLRKCRFLHISVIIPQ